jgi:hypothetical protein
MIKRQRLTDTERHQISFMLATTMERYCLSYEDMAALLRYKSTSSLSNLLGNNKTGRGMSRARFELLAALYRYGYGQYLAVCQMLEPTCSNLPRSRWPSTPPSA